MSEVVYVEVVEKNGKFIYEARDSNHKVIESSKEFGRASTAAQAGADAYPELLTPVKVHGASD